LAGDPFWRERIATRLAASDAMIVLWSRHADASPWVDQEIRAYSGPTLVILMGGTCPRQYGSEHQRCSVTKTADAVCALRSLLDEKPSHGAIANDGRSLCAQDQAILNARREQMQSASTDLRSLLKCIKRPPMLSPTENGDFVINEWDGSRLRRISADKDSGVYVGTEPVTNRQYERFLRERQLEEPPTWNRPEFRIPELPVVGVTWFEAALYAAWVGGGLPTESEWMRAATLLKPEVIFATATGDIDPQLAHYDSRLGDGCPVVATTFAATLGGFYGMCGNTWDWCDSGDAMYKVIKGGGYFDSALFCRIEARYRNSPLDRDCTVGFRISVVEDDESFS
jgi:Sulfatase-modifying factor enzyme 1/MTH538 TIR-like domain (DUF1863)